MNDLDFIKLYEDVETEIIEGAKDVRVLGYTSTALRLIRKLGSSGLADRITAIYDKHSSDQRLKNYDIAILSFDCLGDSNPDALVIAADDEKEEILLSALRHISGEPKVIISGYGHYKFRDQAYEQLLSDLLVPSLANGYPNTLIHLYECLVNAAKLKLTGAIAEFGMYKGGTTMFLSKVSEYLGQDWKIFGFDTFSGFPNRRNVLDMYKHTGCEWRDLKSVQTYLSNRNVDIISGDIVKTCTHIKGEKLILTFIDTDNYSPAEAALKIVQENTVIGGAIVFDHYTGVDKFRYTLGERMAARKLVDDERYFNLHGTGVFYRQR